MDYWKECVMCAFDEAEITATDEQIKIVSDVMAGAHENIGQAYYVPDNPLIAENKELTRKLALERLKVHCIACDGRGRITTQGPHHGSNTECYKCRGEGKIVE